MFWRKIFFLVLVCGVTGVLSAPKRKIQCALDDLPCTTLTADPLFRSIIRGRPDLKVPDSDPLRQGVISGHIDNMNYNFTDAELYGLTNCHIKRHNVNILQLSWSVLLHCPNLVLKSNYEIFGEIGGKPIEGKGQCHIVHDKYRIGLRGGFQFLLDSKGRPHINIIALAFDRLEVVGNVKSEFSNLYNGDVAKSDIMHKYLNGNWKTISFYTQFPTMRYFMKKMIDNINVYLRVVPSNELFFREE